MDGALNPGYSEEEKWLFAESIRAEPETMKWKDLFSYLSVYVRIPAAIVCAALLNRLEGDQIPKDAPLDKYSDDAQSLVIEWMRKRIRQALVHRDS